MYLFFDTETTGTPKNYGAPITDLDNWPRVIQLAFVAYDENRNKTREFCELITPDGWEVPTEPFWIDNGFSTDTNKALGINMFDALDDFLDEYKGKKYLIAHNMSFDYPILGAEMLRYNKRARSTARAEQLCTMKASTNLCKLPKPNGYGYKWPKLEELHRFLFGFDFDGAHDALADVSATAKCFFEMQKRGAI